LGPRDGDTPVPPWGWPDVPWSLSSDFSLLSGVGIAGCSVGGSFLEEIGLGGSIFRGSPLWGVGSGRSGLEEGGPEFGGP